jgi:leucine dehydrogenase
MFLKTSFAGLSCNGAKTVIQKLPGQDRRAIYEAMADVLNFLAGSYVCGPDVGTTEDDLNCIRESSAFVNDLGNNPGPSTALSVISGLLGGLQFRYGKAQLKGRRVLVQGLGSVGSALAISLMKSGAKVSVSEINDERLGGFIATLRALGLTSDVFEEDVHLYDGEVFCPCAMGHAIDEKFVTEASPMIICGSANNQLSEDMSAKKVQEMGHLWLPDFSVNAGAVIEGVMAFENSQDSRERADSCIRATQDRVLSLLQKAKANNLSPEAQAIEDINREGDNMGFI